jgi:2-polyprenyl-6-methoxyphenol hydroxylase-like FAD-dependent oxidoreductase
VTSNRDWRSGDIKFDMIFGESAEQKFGAPYLLAHRGDLHAALASAVPAACIKLNHKLVGLEESGEGVRLAFANGAAVVADAMIGADGVHSIVRDILFGASPVNLRELRKAFAGFHPQVENVLGACPDVHKWAIVDRNSLERWADGNVTLLGDACHPMTRYMAQGAAMAIEDAAVLSRCLDCVEREGVANAFRRFEATRKARTARIQQTSRANTWLSGKTDTDWVYGYDAWTVPLAA